MPLGHEDYAELIVATLENFSDEVYDNIMEKHPTLDFLKNEESSGTGREMVVDLILGREASAAVTDKSGTFDTSLTTEEVLGAAVYSWSDPIVSSVRLPWKELEKNSGPERRRELLKTHVEAMMYQHGRDLETYLHALASAGLNSDKGTEDGVFHSLDEIVSDAAYDADPAGDSSVSAITVGGISSATQDQWVATRREAPLDGSLTIQQAFRRLEHDIADLTSSRHNLDAIIAGRDVFEELEDSLDSKVRYENAQGGQTKFAKVLYGSIEVRYDPQAPAKRAYFLDRKTWSVKSLAGNILKPHKTQFVPGTLDMVQPVATILSVGVNERRANGLLLRPTTTGGAA